MFACPSAYDAMRCLIAYCVIGSVVQQLLGGNVPMEAIVKPVRTAYNAPTGARLLEHINRDGRRPSPTMLAGSVAGAQLGLIFLLYGGARLAGRASPANARRGEPPTRWGLALDTRESEATAVRPPLGRHAWRQVMSFADWPELCHAGAACRSLCAEARADGLWIRLWEQCFETPCPAGEGSLEAGPLFLAELLRPRRCVTCGESFNHACEGADSNCRVHPGLIQQVHFYPVVWRFSCCGGCEASRGCRAMGQHSDLPRPDLD